MDPVDVLLRRDRLDDPVLVEVARQRQLDEEAVDRVVGVERRDRREDVLLGRVRRELDVARLHARGGRGLLLQVDVDVRSGVVADEDGREPDVAEIGDRSGDFLAHFRAESLAVEEGRCHASRHAYSHG